MSREDLSRAAGEHGRMARMKGNGRPGIFARLVYWITRLKMGRVVEPIRLHAHSMPALFGMSVMQTSQTSASELPATLKLLAHIRIANKIDCPF